MRRVALLFTAALLVFNVPAQCWWENGHRVTARLAASYLTPVARTRLAAIMGVPDNPQSVADGLALLSTWPDEIRKARPETGNWHFVDIARQDKEGQISERCPGQNCVTARIELFEEQLVKDKSSADPSRDLDALRFLVHFVGDLHQPLHAISDADLGGNCESLLRPYEKARNLHALWDGPLVNDINVDTALLTQDLRRQLDSFGQGRRQKMARGSVDDWAWESHKLAEKVIYKRLNIPKAPVIFPASCKVAPTEILQSQIEVKGSYVLAMKPVVRLQLERAGLRLARLLNEL